MDFHGGAHLNWSQFERLLAGRSVPEPVPVDHRPSSAPRLPRSGPTAVPFAGLHAVSSYSFLAGVPGPGGIVTNS